MIENPMINALNARWLDHHSDMVLDITTIFEKNEVEYSDGLELITALTNTKENLYHILGGRWRNFKNSPGEYAIFLSLVLHAMYDDGEVCLTYEDETGYHLHLRDYWYYVGRSDCKVYHLDDGLKYFIEWLSDSAYIARENKK